jgi:opacity protein-like surface antigen
MKKNYRLKGLSAKGFKRLLFIVFISVLTFTHAHAQDSQDGNGADQSSTNDGPTGPGGGPGDPDVPIDGGISLLIAAGIGYGMRKKHLDAKKEKEDELNNVE